MNTKQMIGLVLLAAGVVLIIFSMQSFNRISHQEGLYEKADSFIQNKVIDKIYSEKVHGKAHGYRVGVGILLVGGVLLSIAGMGTVIYYRKR